MNETTTTEKFVLYSEDLKVFFSFEERLTNDISKAKIYKTAGDAMRDSVLQMKFYRRRFKFFQIYGS